MLRMDQVHVIRHKVLVEGRSQRSVARELGVSRNTVSKYLTQSEPRRVESKPRRRRVMEQVAPRLEELLEGWSRRSTAKQRVTGTRLHAQLIEEGYEVGVTTVRAYVREWRRQRQEVYIPLVHRPGEEGQVDFFEVTVEENGVAHRVWKFLMHLPYSGRSFAWLYDSCDQIAFLDGHVRAFAHFGGVPERLVYDNLSAAVRRRVGAERELTERFSALSSHYLFEPCFARPGVGHDKGSVEARGKGIRLRHMSPVPQGRSLSEIASSVLSSIEAVWQQQDPQRWQEEAARLRALPQSPFEARKLEVVRVSRQATVQLRGATYSVPARWKSLSIHARIGVEDVVFFSGEERYECERVRKGKRRVQYSHYFEELSRKPQAVRQVAPELLEELGPAYRKLWRMLDLRYGARETSRLFARLLAVVVDEGSEQVAEALEEALRAGRFDLLHLVERCEPLEAEVPERLRCTRSSVLGRWTSMCCCWRRRHEPGSETGRHGRGAQATQDAVGEAGLRGASTPGTRRAVGLRGLLA